MRLISIPQLIYCFFLFLPLCCTQTQYDVHDNDDRNYGTCQNLDILMVQNSTLRTGMHLQLYQTSTMTLSTLDVIPNHYLPPECGDQNQRCGILNFEYSGISYYIIPSIRGFVTLSLYINNTQEPQKSFIDITEECNPIKAFYAGPEGRYHIVIACMDLQTRPRGIIYYLQYYFNVGRGSVIKNAELLTLSEPIYNPETVSEIIYVRGQQRCAEYDNLYFIDDAYVLHYPSDTFDPEFISSNDALQNCIGYQNIEYYGMNDYLLIRCSNNRTVLYDSCASHFTYQSPDRVPYPCSNGPDMIIYRNGSQLTFKHQHNNDTQGSQLLPFGELTYGTCIHTQGDVPTFIGIANDGTVFIVHFGDRISNINHVSFPKGSISYDGPIFTESRQAFGVYNVTSKEFLVINVTVECTQYPILHHISLSDHFSPDLIAINVRKGSYNCSCQKLETHHPPIRKWLRFGIPAIIFSALLFMVFGGATLVFIAKKCQQRTRSLYQSYRRECLSTEIDLICTSTTGHLFQQYAGGQLELTSFNESTVGVYNLTLTMPGPIEVVESDNLPNNGAPNNDLGINHGSNPGIRL